MANSIGDIARRLTLGSPSSTVNDIIAVRKAKRKNRRSNTSSSSSVGTSTSSSGVGKRTTSTSSSSGGKLTKADAVAFNKLSDKARKASKGKIAAFQAAGFGVFEDYSVHTSGKGFGKFFDKTSPKYKKRNK